MSFIKKEDLIEEIQSYGLPYDHISIHKIIEIINKQLIYVLTSSDHTADYTEISYSDHT